MFWKGFDSSKRTPRTMSGGCKWDLCKKRRLNSPPFSGKDLSFNKRTSGPTAAEKKAELQSRLAALRKHNMALEREHDHLMHIKRQTEDHVDHTLSSRHCYMTMDDILSYRKRKRSSFSTTSTKTKETGDMVLLVNAPPLGTDFTFASSSQSSSITSPTR
jgi:hypothetical protein